MPVADVASVLVHMKDFSIQAEKIAIKRPATMPKAIEVIGKK
jgi:hypothetical protein